MEPLRNFFAQLYALEELIQWGGYAVLVAIVFAENGLLLGFFLPGDSLLIVAGLFAARGVLEIGTLILLLTVAAIAGETVGYWFGMKTGPRLFARPDSRWFKREHLLKARAFYEQHGAKTIVIARFVPFLRTFAPIVAGVAGMEWRSFLAYNILGGIVWVVSLTVAGYSLGSVFTRGQIDRYLHLIIAAIIFFSILPAFVHAVRERRKRRAAGQAPGVDAERRETSTVQSASTRR